ncbi:COG4-domain-containing protein [Neocallimastix californiae]|uniref:Conserved oligomeric Golgi complex subunit 4 n=1 Tax=Neocallimastix californiae TaxID=1754190 RepID=A0A1Y2AE75_9FUNG|nr:COG4-domain-containing protein [Neocallimastix californiae]|eukprot:ORY20883.1 COG4-domain-containing protein [Neocallimastix californiae]
MATEREINDIISTLSLDEIKELTDINVIQKQLRLLNEEETILDQELDSIISRKDDYEKKLSTIEGLKMKINFLNNSSVNLLHVIDKTVKVSDNISCKVRSIDLEQSRVLKTISLVDNMQEIKNYANGVEMAMRGKDYETAAGYIKKYLSLDPEILKKIYKSEENNDLSNGNKEEVPTKILEGARRRLVEIFNTEFDAAARSGNEEIISKYFKLYPCVGHKELGLDKYASYICDQLVKQCQDKMRITENISEIFFAELLIRLYEITSTLIDKQERIINYYYGDGYTLRIIQRLQNEVERQGILILNAFLDKREIERKINDIKTSDSGSSWKGNSNTDNIVVNPRELDIILSEMVLISQRTFLYNNFVNYRAMLESQKLSKNETDKTLITALGGCEENGLVKDSKLNKKVDEIQKYYIKLEEYYISKNIQKALKIDEYDTHRETSCSVEDVFYIVQKSTDRIISISNTDVISTLLKIIGRILNKEYIQYFFRNIQGIFNSSDHKDLSVILLNNVDVSCVYINKLADELNKKIKNIFSITNEESEENKTILIAINSLKDNSTAFRQVLNKWILNCFNEKIKGRIKPLLNESFKDIKYILNDDEYAEQDSNNLFVKRLINGINKLITPFKNTFTESNYNYILLLLIDYLNKEIERYIINNYKFNQLGALKLDQDLRSIISYFSSISNMSIRDKFSNLTQISNLLNLEKLSDIYDIWNSNKANNISHLSSNEAKKVLLLRNDFVEEEISQLKI